MVRVVLSVRLGDGGSIINCGCLAVLAVSVVAVHGRIHGYIGWKWFVGCGVVGKRR